MYADASVSHMLPICADWSQNPDAIALWDDDDFEKVSTEEVRQPSPAHER